jgi:hypothetical protein
MGMGAQATRRHASPWLRDFLLFDTSRPLTSLLYPPAPLPSVPLGGLNQHEKLSPKGACDYFSPTTLTQLTEKTSAG